MFTSNEILNVIPFRLSTSAYAPDFDFSPRSSSRPTENRRRWIVNPGRRELMYSASERENVSLYVFPSDSSE